MKPTIANHIQNIRKPVLIVLGISIFSITGIFAQEPRMQARIIDSVNNVPVSFSTIIFNETTGTISDETGFFQYRLDRIGLADSFEVSCIGYQTRKIRISDMELTRLDTIYLLPAVVGIGEIEVISRAKRTKTAEQIVNRAIVRIPENLDEDTLYYRGYYREYLRQEDDFINLFENVVSMQDPGINDFSVYNFNLEFKKINESFPFDSYLLEQYDNQDKYIPYALIRDEEFNELARLRAIDPIRNLNGQSVSFIKRFSYDFLRNHDLMDPKLTYQDGLPFYYIEYRDNRNYTYGMTRVKMTGSMYIDVDDFGIRKLNYRAVLDQGMRKQKLFELTVEYAKTDGKYRLLYSSYNNLFKSRNFVLEDADFKDRQLVLTFSNPPDPETSDDPANYIISLQGFNQQVENIRTKENRVFISFDKSSLLSDKLDYDPAKARSNFLARRKINRKIKVIKENLSLEFKNLRDIRGKGMQSEEFTEYYQYREFFVNETLKEIKGFKDKLLDVNIPVAENSVVADIVPDTAWLNTPLIKEELLTGDEYSTVPRQNIFLEMELDKLNNRVNEEVYVQTDREVYAQDDTLWFKGYVRNEAWLTPSPVSRSFYIKLLDSKGEIKEEKKYIISDSETHGHFNISNSYNEGIYTLVAYSSWMKNFSPEKIFSKQILVQNETRPGVHLVVSCNKKEYFPGDTILLQVKLNDLYNRDLGDVKIDYSLMDGKKVISKGKSSTVTSTKFPVRLIVPYELENSPEIKVNCTYKMYYYDVSYPLPVNYFINVGFYPEGGHLLYGERSRVAFKVVSAEDRPVNIEGVIVGEDGKKLMDVKTRINGMGEFQYRPSEDENYFLRITKPAGFTKEYPLPDARSKGWLLGVRLIKDKFRIKINHNFDSFQIGLIALSVRGYVDYYKVAGIGKNYELDIPVADLPEGVGVITLFDRNMIPQAERLVYISNTSNNEFRMETEYNTYLPRDSVILNFRLASPELIKRGSYSLTVYDEILGGSDRIPDMDIRKSLLYSDEIKGEIYNFEDYTGSGEEAGLNRDLLLLTQGWRDYSYALGSDPDYLRKPRDMDIIYGRLLSSRIGAVEVATSGIVSIYAGGNSYRTIVEEGNYFSVDPVLSEENNTDIFLSAVDRGGSDRVSIDLDVPEFERQLDDYMDRLARETFRDPREIYSFNSFLDHFSRGIENHVWLEEVVIRKTVTPKEFNRASLALDKRTATRDQLDAAIDMEHLTEMIYVPNRTNSPVYYSIDGVLQVSMEIIDMNQGGVQIPDYTLVSAIDPRDIEEYTVIRGPEAQALYGYNIEYVIDVRLKPQNERGSYDRWMNPVILPKYEVSREFYKPSYDTEAKKYSSVPDLRKTIHWEPELQIDENGEARVKFYNGDRYTRIRCVFEGITSDGRPFHSEYSYDVGVTRE